MSDVLTMPYKAPLAKKRVLCGNFSGLDRRAFPQAGGLSYAENLATDKLPFLHGQGKMEDRSVVASGAAMQNYIFVLENTLYLVGFDGSYMNLYRVNKDKNSLIHTFTQKLTTEEATDAVQDSVLCGKGYGADARGRRLLLYPLGYSAVVSEDGSMLSDFVDIGALSDRKGFISAQIHENRLFATDGYSIYASRPESLVSFVETPGNEQDDSPWCAQIPEEAENEKPIQGLIKFKGQLYYFGHHSFGRIRGGSCPFYVEELFSKGTVNIQSVQVVEDKLLFLAKEGVYAFDGSRLELISQKLDLVDCTDGVAGVKNGIYYLALPDTERSIVYTYCPKNNSWGCMELSGKVKMFAAGEQDLYCLTEKGIHYGIYRLTDTHSDGFMAVAVLDNGEELHSKKLRRVKLLCNLEEGDSLDCDLQIVTKEGDVMQIPFLRSQTGNGTAVFSKTVTAPEGRLFFMVLSAIGNAAVGGYELTFEKGVDDDG